MRATLKKLDIVDKAIEVLNVPLHHFKLTVHFFTGTSETIEKLGLGPPELVEGGKVQQWILNTSQLMRLHQRNLELTITSLLTTADFVAQDGQSIQYAMGQVPASFEAFAGNVRRHDQVNLGVNATGYIWTTNAPTLPGLIGPGFSVRSRRTGEQINLKVTARVVEGDELAAASTPNQFIKSPQDSGLHTNFLASASARIPDRGALAFHRPGAVLKNGQAVLVVVIAHTHTAR